MNRVNFAIAVVAALAGATSAFGGGTMTPADAFNAGKSAGAESNVQANVNTINATRANQVMPGYVKSPPQAGYWNGGISVGDTKIGGNTKIVDCDKGVGIATASDKNHCEAVNAIAKQGDLRPPGLIDKHDALYVKGRAIGDKPEAIIPGMDGLYGGCTTLTKTTDPDKTVETCDEYATTGDKKCQIGQIVEVDADHLYKCKDSIKVVENSSCTVGRVIRIDPDANYQCVSTPLEHQTLKCYKVTNVTATPGPYPNPNSQTICGLWEGYYFNSQNKLRAKVLSGTFANTPSAQSAVVTIGTYHYRNVPSTVRFVVSAKDPDGVLLGTTTCENDCSAVVPGYGDQCVPACILNVSTKKTGTYRITVAIEMGQTVCIPDPDNFWHCLGYQYNPYPTVTKTFSAYIEQAQLPPTITYAIDNQCASLEARAQ